MHAVLSRAAALHRDDLGRLADWGAWHLMHRHERLQLNHLWGEQLESVASPKKIGCQFLSGKQHGMEVTSEHGTQVACKCWILDVPDWL